MMSSSKLHISQNPIVSIIVPVFNTPKKYLDRCLNSIFAQSYSALDIILIDDGSIQECSSYCDCFAQKNNKIRVFHQQNSGVSSARNMGIKAISGKYCMFIDPDDELADSDCIQNAVYYAETNNADIVVGRVIYQFARKAFTSNLFEEAELRVYSDKNEIEELSSYFFNFFSKKNSSVPHTLSRGPVAKLFKSSTISGLVFDENLQYAEDGLFCSDACKVSNVVVIVDNAWYRYYQYKKSAAHSKGANQCKIHCEGCLAHYPGGGQYAPEAFFTHCIIDTCITLFQTKGFRSLSDIKWLLSQKWVTEYLSAFNMLDFCIPKWKYILINEAKRDHAALVCMILWFGNAYLHLQGKRLIGN